VVITPSNHRLKWSNGYFVGFGLLLLCNLIPDVTKPNPKSASDYSKRMYRYERQSDVSRAQKGKIFVGPSDEVDFHRSSKGFLVPETVNINNKALECQYWRVMSRKPACVGLRETDGPEICSRASCGRVQEIGSLVLKIRVKLAYTFMKRLGGRWLSEAENESSCPTPVCGWLHNMFDSWWRRQRIALGE
jgi:hypothetical protein